ncbi:hypothetical protein CHU98_g4721 [Xylaria longipes]|nr:hypothetical protein CHU98_g4721 [Xylaria longipes]
MHPSDNPALLRRSEAVRINKFLRSPIPQLCGIAILKTMAATGGTLTFLKRGSWPAHERPYELLFQPPGSSFPVSNYSVIQVPNVPIYDLRSLKDKLSLDREGFLVADIDTSMEYEDYFDQDKLKTTYMPKIKTFLKEKLGVRAVYVHEYVSRVGRGDIQAASASRSRMFIPLLEQLTGDKAQAEAIKSSRIQMLNIWKPLRGPVRSWPLALCDLRSLNREDVIPFDEVHAKGVLESQQVAYSPSQKWYYLPNQNPNEIIVFKSMDTASLMGPSMTQNVPTMDPPEKVLNSEYWLCTETHDFRTISELGVMRERSLAGGYVTQVRIDKDFGWGGRPEFFPRLTGLTGLTGLTHDASDVI